MYCLICEPIVKLKETSVDGCNGLFVQNYVCPECDEVHYCTSQSGDMIQEYLELGAWE